MLARTRRGRSGTSTTACEVFRSLTVLAWTSYPLRLRFAYVQGAEAYSRDTLDGGLTTDELGRIIERYEGR